MNPGKTTLWLIMTCSAFFINSQLAGANALPDDGNYWQCSVSDRANNQWLIKHAYERTAINLAYDACKKHSPMPESCKASKEGCESFTHGITNRPMWKCTALDQKAAPWVSNIYTLRDDAALAAKAYCQQSSTVPATCYLNMLTCKNLNERL